MISHSALNIGTLHQALGHDDDNFLLDPCTLSTLFHDLFELILLFVCQIGHVNCETEN